MNYVCTVHFLWFVVVQSLSTVIACELLLAAFLYLRVLLVINLLVHLMHHLSTGISSQELLLLQQRTEQPLAKTTSTLMWMLLVLSMECLYMSLIWTQLMINPGENRVRISLKCQLSVWGCFLHPSWFWGRRRLTLTLWLVIRDLINSNSDSNEMCVQ